jgi:serine/threonine protein kinase
VAEDKRTKIGSTGPLRQTGSQAVAASVTPTPATDPPVVTASSGAKTSYLPAMVDPLLGQTLAGRYVIQKKLGEGGMGAVYLATHNLLDKQVALKILHNEFARKQDLVERFMQEAKSASRIRHENVIDISDFGTTNEGLVFFAMELLKGHDLHEEVARARLAGELLPWSRSKKIFLQICAALTAAHAQGIIHRDLKPENVYLIEFLGEPDFVKLLDFGIAKLTEVDEGGRKLTKTGMLFGTPEYMSPEQARGENVDHRVDVYAMGCILFQLVTGRVPFEAENFMGVLSMHLTEPPPGVPVEVLDRIGAPRELAGVIDKALAKDRNARWSTIDELANAVRTASGDPAASKHPTQRAASVPAPAMTTTSRQRTKWTGSLSVPQADEPAQRAKSKLPLILGVVAVLGGGGIAAMFALRGGSSTTGTEPGSASGSTGSALAGGSGTLVTAPPPDAPPAVVLPPLPERVKIRIDSKPQGAEVRDLAKDRVLGKTPVKLDVKATREQLSFGLHLKGYSDAIVDLTPDKDIDYVAPLEKGASGGAPKRQVVPDPGLKKPPEMVGSAAKPPPETGTGSAAKPPETGSAAKPPETGSAAKPPETGSAAKAPPDPEDECVDFPCVKKVVPGLKGSAAGSAGSGG